MSVDFKSLDHFVPWIQYCCILMSGRKNNMNKYAIQIVDSLKHSIQCLKSELLDIDNRLHILRTDSFVHNKQKRVSA